YDPVGLIYANEESIARGFEGDDNTIRIHFNLPSNLKPEDLLTVTFDPLNLDTQGLSDPRYGVEVYFNNVLVQPQVLIRPPRLGHAVTTARFTADSVNAQAGPGFDNIVTLKGISYSGQGGGSSLGFDYIKLVPIPRIV